MQLVNERLRELKSWLTARDDDMTRLIAACFLHNLVLTHFREGLMLRVAEGT
jgi:hypothetical protein